MPDIKELNDRIKNCIWRKRAGEEYTCISKSFSCKSVVEKGDCEVVGNFFKEKNDMAKLEDEERRCKIERYMMLIASMKGIGFSKENIKNYVEELYQDFNIDKEMKEELIENI
jgi:hypothetical protein